MSARPRAALAREHAIALGVLAAILTLNSIYVFVSDATRTDFEIFYRSGQAYLTGTPLYAIDDVTGATLARPDATRVNLNPPSLTLLVYAPLAMLPLGAAAFVWSVTGLLAATASVHCIRRALQLPSEHLIFAVSAVALLPGSVMSWQEGQPTWLLLYPMTLAWDAYRRGRYIVSGIWSGLVVAVKPFFALALLLLGLVPAAVAAATAAAVSLITMTISGWQPWADWLALGGVVTWVSFPGNASVPGFLARLLSEPFQPFPISRFPVGAIAIWLAASALMLMFARAIPRRRTEARWLSSFLSAVLISPLGWIYYMPLMMGAAIGWWWCRWQPSVFRTTVLLLNWTPFAVFVPLILHDADWLRVAGTVYTVGLVGAWGVITYDGLRHEPQRDVFAISEKGCPS